MGKATYILGINAYHGDASAVLLKDGSVVAAVEEERFSRMKHSAGFPSHAIRYCLRRAGISISEVDHIGISRVPSAHLINKITFVLYNRLMFTQQGLDRLRNVDRIRNIQTVLADSLGVRESDLKMEFHNVEHHVAHMASAFLVSPFQEAALLPWTALVISAAPCSVAAREETSRNWIPCCFLTLSVSFIPPSPSISDFSITGMRER